MNLTGRTPAASAMNPSTFPNVNWKEKAKVFPRASGATQSLGLRWDFETTSIVTCGVGVETVDEN